MELKFGIEKILKILLKIRIVANSSNGVFCKLMIIKSPVPRAPICPGIFAAGYTVQLKIQNKMIVKLFYFSPKQLTHV